MAEEEFDSSEFSFLYFAITILSLILLPLTYKIVKPLLNTFIFGSYRKDPRYKKLSSHSSS
jgi:translocation protein SEC63